MRTKLGQTKGILLLAFVLAPIIACQAEAPANVATATPEIMATEPPPTATTPPPSPTAIDTATPEPSATPQPTATNEPAATDEPADETEAQNLFMPVADEPVVPHGPSGAWDGQYTDPGAVVTHDGLFHMFHNGFVGWPAPVGIAYSTSPDGRTWTRVQEDPVFRGDDLDYVGLTVLASSALVQDDGTWVLYFYTWDDNTWPGAPSSIGRATAPDPLGPWTADAQPVLLPGPEGSWDSLAVRAPSVVRSENGYVMFYGGFDGQEAMIGMATSPDGVQWTKFDVPETSEAPFAQSDPVFLPGEEGAWDEGNVVNPRVVRSPQGYMMAYSAVPRLNVSSTLGYAVSEDGVTWQRAAEPILDYTAVPGGRAIWFSELAYQDGTYFLFFELGTGGQTEVYLATHEGDLP